MSKDCENRYKVSRTTAGMTQEQAADLLGVASRTLSDYENGHAKVPDDIVAKMTEIYHCPMLAWWHIKNTSVLGRFLPDITEPQTQGDMAFQLILAQDDLTHAVSTIKQLVAGGGISTDNQETFLQSIQTILSVKAKLLSTSIYGRKIIIKGATPVAPGSGPIEK